MFSWLAHKYHTYKQRLYWNSPDEWVAVIYLDNDKKNWVYGMVKGSTALIDHIPPPGTGYHYYDIVKIEGPIGSQSLKDDRVHQYRVIGMEQRSGCPTYVFDIVIPGMRDYLQLQSLFKGRRRCVEVPWPEKNGNTKIVTGLCTVPNMAVAEGLLSEFVKNGEGRKVNALRAE